ncbi:MAG: hypothetical protein JXA14_09395 [Anaerolineae bacterium]|nr:hypothetical protein [Anaerolineae bacterium]
MLQVTPHNVADVSGSLADDRLAYQTFWDRASESDARFTPLVRWAEAHAVRCINPYERARLTWDKSRMHLALIGAGLHTPYTIILPPYDKQPEIPPINLSPLGDCFAIKPAHGGGSEGVILEATSHLQALAARQEHPSDEYLLQVHVTPVQLGPRPAWFRVINCTGQVYPCWWDTCTHVYTPVTPAEEADYRLGPLRDTAASIAGICGLDLFSTEVALTADGHFVVVDYVNDQIDLRLQSKAADGVPDGIVHDIVARLSRLVAAAVLSDRAEWYSAQHCCSD